MNFLCCCFSPAPASRSPTPPPPPPDVELVSPRASEPPSFTPALVSQAQALPPLAPDTDVEALHQALRHAPAPASPWRRLDDIDMLFWRASQAGKLTPELFRREVAARCKDSAEFDDMGPRVTALFRQGAFNLCLRPGGEPAHHQLWECLPILFRPARAAKTPVDALAAVSATQARMMGVVSTWLLTEDEGRRALGGFSSLSRQTLDRGLRALLQGATVVSYWNRSLGHWEDLLGAVLTQVMVAEPKVPFRDLKGQAAGQEAGRREVAQRLVAALCAQVPNLPRALVPQDVLALRAVRDEGHAAWGREVAQVVTQECPPLIPDLAAIVGAYVGGDTPVRPFLSFRRMDD